MILVSFRCLFRQIGILTNHSLSFPELADDKSRSSVVERASERGRDVSFVDLLTIKSMSTDLVTGKTMGHFKTVCVNDR